MPESKLPQEQVKIDENILIRRTATGRRVIERKIIVDEVLTDVSVFDDDPDPPTGGRSPPPGHQHEGRRK